MTTSPPTISVVVITYNSAAVIQAALDPLYRRPGIEIIVRDNASMDNTVALLTSSYPDVLLLKGSENVGFARAVNEAASHASGKSLLLLNPDAVVDAKTLLRLETRLWQHGVGVVAPLVEQPAGRLRILEAGRIPTLRRMVLHWSGLSRLSQRWPALEGAYLLTHDVGAARDIDWVSGACLLVRKSLWEEFHGLTERWFMYAEDTEFCLRLRQAGWRIQVDPTLHATHTMGGSSTPMSADEERPPSDWICNLFDLYADEIASCSIQRLTWRLVVAGGLLTRSVVFEAKALLGPRNQFDWRREAFKFRVFAVDLLRHDPANPTATERCP